MEYATAECTDCGAILPRNLLLKFKETAVVGEFASGRPKTDRHDAFLCEPCLKRRKALIEREEAAAAELRAFAAARAIEARGRMVRNIVLGCTFVVALIAAALLWSALSTRAPAPGVANEAVNRTDVAETTGPSSDSDQKSSAAPSPPTAAALPVASTAPNAPPQAIPLPSTSDLRDLIREALDKGQAVPWGDSEQKGYVVVSSITRNADGRDCRSFQITSGERKSEPQNVCRQDDGTWTEGAD